MTAVEVIVVRLPSGITITVPALSPAGQLIAATLLEVGPPPLRPGEPWPGAVYTSSHGWVGGTPGDPKDRS